jgi:hypothetical protein
MPQRNRLALAVLIGLLNFVIITAYHLTNPNAVNDLGFPLCAGRVLLAGGDPYGDACRTVSSGHIWPTNPLTTVLVTLPFAPFGNKGALPAWAIMSGILAFGLLREGGSWRLLAFLSAPYWIALLCLNWTPLMASLAMLPALTPLWLVKPQNGLPAFITHFTWRRAAVAAAFLSISLVIDPTWPMRWWPQAQGYDFFIPLILIPFGPLILLGLLFWRDRKMRYVLMLAAMPQRFLYDPLLLMWVPDSLSEMLVLIASGWIGYALVLALELPYQHIVVFFCYLPAVAVRWQRLHSQRANLPILQADSRS